MTKFKTRGPLFIFLMLKNELPNPLACQLQEVSGTQLLLAGTVKDTHSSPWIRQKAWAAMVPKSVAQGWSDSPSLLYLVSSPFFDHMLSTSVFQALLSPLPDPFPTSESLFIPCAKNANHVTNAKI